MRFGKDGLRVQSLGERGSGADMYRRVILRNAHFGARKREVARLAQLAEQAETEEVYVLKLSDIKGPILVVSETKQISRVDSVKEAETRENEEELSEKMDVDPPEFGDIALLPDIPDMDFEDEQPHHMTS